MWRGDVEGMRFRTNLYPFVPIWSIFRPFVMKSSVQVETILATFWPFWWLIDQFFPRGKRYDNGLVIERGNGGGWWGVWTTRRGERSGEGGAKNWKTMVILSNFVVLTQIYMKPFHHGSLPIPNPSHPTPSHLVESLPWVQDQWSFLSCRRTHKNLLGHFFKIERFSA